MLLDEYVEVSINHKNMKHYENLGYSIPKKIGKTGKAIPIQGSKIKVKSSHLTRGSNVYIKAICDYCGETYTVMFNNYNKSRNKGVQKDACKKCIQRKREDNMLLKYNVRTPFEVKEFKEKAKKTINSRYGVDYASQSPEIKKKISETCLERYGAENPFSSSEIKEKIARINIEKYGTKYPSQNKNIKNKTKTTNMNRYGVPCALQNPQIREKAKQTMIDKYGCDNPSKSSVIQEKKYKTNLSKYGVKIPSLNAEVKYKIMNTNLKKYGYENVFSSPIIQEKIKQTNREKYGVDRPLQSKEIQRKIQKSIMSNEAMCSSSQQRHVNNLYNGKLNYHMSKFFVDIFVEKDMLCIEYDGGGHDLSVQTGKITQEEFDKKEMIREKIIKSYGNRIVRIIAPTDKLPSDEILLQMRDNALEYFNATNHTWRNYYVELGIMKDAEHKDGAKYDYGKLWNAKILAKKNKSA